MKLERKISKIIKNDPKAFYKYTRSKMKTKETVGPLHDEHDNLITDKNQTSEIFNKYFLISLHPRTFECITRTTKYL